MTSRDQQLPSRSSQAQMVVTPIANVSHDRRDDDAMRCDHSAYSRRLRSMGKGMKNVTVNIHHYKRNEDEDLSRGT